jgi:hypothetical protein
MIIGVSVFGHAQGGPPLRTDDPATPGNGNFEVNVGVTVDRRAGEREFETPRIDVNYGLGDRIQLKYEIPWVVRSTDFGPTKNGLGNSLGGVKWRFYENKERELSFSIYPQMEFNNPNNSVDRGLATRGIGFLMPFEATKKVGPVDVNGEVGYRIVQYARDEWITGLALGKQATERLELLGELYATGKTNGDDRETTFGFGGRYKLHGPITLLFMAGRSFRGPSTGEPQFIGYAGLQFVFSAMKNHKRTAGTQKEGKPVTKLNSR